MGVKVWEVLVCLRTGEKKEEVFWRLKWEQREFRKASGEDWM